MKLESYEYRDPGQVVRDVAAAHPLRAGDVLLALVREPSGAQEVVSVTRLPPERWADLDGYGLSQLLGEFARMMPIPDGWGPPRHSIATVVVRPGWAVIGRDDGRWVGAWLYSNHLTRAFTGELIVVTEHGWTDLTTGWGGYEPRLEVGDAA